MKWKVLSIATVAGIAYSTMSSIPVSMAHAVETESTQKSIQVQEKETNRNGLLGYYFEGENFSKPIIVSPTSIKNMAFDNSDNLGLISASQTFQSMRWMGYIVSNKTKEVELKLSNADGAKLEINDQLVSQQGTAKKVHLEQGKPIPIKVEYTSSKKLALKDIENIQLISVDSTGREEIIDQEQLRNPQFSNKEWQKKISTATKSNLYHVKSDDELEDTDGDGIFDAWEINGYTIQNKKAVAWKDEFAEKGYTKFTSNPLEAHTVGDPYSDYEKAARDMDASNAKETVHPLVAAYPSINVSLEKVVLSKNEDLSSSVGSNSSNNWSSTNTVGASIEASGSLLGPSFGVSANYQHSSTNALEWGHSIEDTSHLNQAETAYLNANVRYNNTGTGSIYNAKPTTSFVLNGSTIGTIKAKDNTTALSITPGESYPKKGKHGIAINTMDDFNSRPIPLNKKQLQAFLANKPIMLETDQVEGEYKVKDIHGNVVTGGQWNGVTQQIEAKTASIIIDEGEVVSEKRVAAKDYENPEDKTPSLTLKEALKLAYPQIKEKEGLLYYKEKPIYESSVMTYLDQNTAQEIKKQLNDTTGQFKDVKKLYDVKLTPKMTFTIKIATLYDGAEDGAESLGYWYSSEKVSGGNTGKKQYRTIYQDSDVYLDPDKLKKDSNYIFSMYMKAAYNTKLPIEIYGEKGIIASKEVELTNTGYQRVDIPIKNLSNNLVQKIFIGNRDRKAEVSWDDVTFTEAGAAETENKVLTDNEVRAIYSSSSKNIDYDFSTLNSVRFNNIKPLMGEKVKGYRVVYTNSAYPYKNFDLTRPPYAYENDGSILVNFLEYNKGRGLDINDLGISVSVYVVLEDERIIDIFSYKTRL